MTNTKLRDLTAAITVTENHQRDLDWLLRFIDLVLITEYGPDDEAPEYVWNEDGFVLHATDTEAKIIWGGRVAGWWIARPRPKPRAPEPAKEPNHGA
jgi:hypothetical protein